MGGLFGGGKPSGPSAGEIAAQRRQEARLLKQEKRADAQEASKQRQISAGQRARRTGGLRMLLAQREDAQAGLKDTLGVG
jgi:hypothetical protein|tara:strand:- start:7873 stop:8112 length:240 start_codon:yes stop_codon:yes gene_type:complete